MQYIQAQIPNYHKIYLTIFTEVNEVNDPVYKVEMFDNELVNKFINFVY